MDFKTLCVIKLNSHSTTPSHLLFQLKTPARLQCRGERVKESREGVNEFSCVTAIPTCSDKNKRIPSAQKQKRKQQDVCLPTVTSREVFVEAII